MQLQNFLKAINGQADSSTIFFVLSLGAREGCLTCVSLTQNCSDVGARCVLVCDALSPSLLQLPSICRLVHRRTVGRVGGVLFPESVSLCHLEVFAFTCCSGHSYSLVALYQCVLWSSAVFHSFILELYLITSFLQKEVQSEAQQVVSPFVQL